jgi:hypothetical protein
MGWGEELRRRLTAAEEAVEAVKGGDLLLMAIARPWAAADALARLRQEDA